MNCLLVAELKTLRMNARICTSPSPTTEQGPEGEGTSFFTHDLTHNQVVEERV